MEVFLFRHGETEYNVNNVLIGGRSNHLPVNLNGADQSRRLGHRLKRSRVVFDSVYASIALRCLQTAEQVCEIIGFPKDRIIQSEELQELHQGDWEGKPRAQIYTPEVLKTINQDNWRFVPPNGESQKTVEDRMLHWLGTLNASEPMEADARRIGVFSHGFAIQCLLRGLLNFDCKKTFLMEIQNTSITKVKLKNGKWIPTSINDVAHLEP